MLPEVSVAVSYVLSHLYTKLPRRRVDNFGEELERSLYRKFQSHWFADKPTRDSAFRCLHTGGPQTDFLLPEAAMSSGLEWAEIQTCLPIGLTIAIDPGYVASQFQTSVPNDAGVWPSVNYSGVNLSSSGCSSASSSTTSSNSSGFAGNSWLQTRNQVLYTAANATPVNGDFTMQTLISNDLFPSPELTPNLTSDDLELHLATEAALSVLTDPDEVASIARSNDLQEEVHICKRDIKLPQPLSKHFKSRSDTGSIGEQQTFHNSGALDPIMPLEEELASQFLLSQSASRFSEESGINELNGQYSSFQSFEGGGDDGTQLPDFLPTSTALEISGLNCSNFPRALAAKRETELKLLEMQQNAMLKSQQPVQTSPQFIQKSTSTPSFTAASFAQTKFGSTKLKSRSKRPNRLVSPSELGGRPSPFQFMESSAFLTPQPAPVADRSYYGPDIIPTTVFGQQSHILETRFRTAGDAGDDFSENNFGHESLSGLMTNTFWSMTPPGLPHRKSVVSGYCSNMLNGNSSESVSRCAVTGVCMPTIEAPNFNLLSNPIDQVGHVANVSRHAQSTSCSPPSLVIEMLSSTLKQGNEMATVTIGSGTNVGNTPTSAINGLPDTNKENGSLDLSELWNTQHLGYGWPGRKSPSTFTSVHVGPPSGRMEAAEGSAC